MKPAIPKYLEHTAFGTQAQRLHPFVFRENENAGATIAQMLPQRLISRSPTTAHNTGAKYAEPIVEAGDEQCSYVATFPFASGSSAVYFEVEIEPMEESVSISDICVNIGIEKRNVSNWQHMVESHSHEQSSEDFDDTSDVEEEVYSSSNANTSLSAASWSGSAKEEFIESSGNGDSLFHHSASAVISTLDRSPIRDWVWKLASGMLVSKAHRSRPLNHIDLQLSEPLKSPIKHPLRVGFCLNLVSNEIVLTRNGRIVATHAVGSDHSKNKSNTLSDCLVLVPTIMVRNARVRAIFGDGNLPNDGFLFDITAYCRSQFRLPALTNPVNEENGSEKLMQLIVEYFAFYGYAESVRACMRCHTNLTVPTLSQIPMASVALRGQIRKQICQGNIDRVYDLLASAGVTKLSADLKFKLEFQAFVQLVRTSTDINRVLDHGRLLFIRYNADANDDVRAKLEQASGLLVSNGPHDSIHEALYGREAIYKLITVVLSAVSEAEGATPLPKINCALSDTSNLLNRFARRGNGTASMVAGELARQMGWH